MDELINDEMPCCNYPVRRTDACIIVSINNNNLSIKRGVGACMLEKHIPHAQVNEEGNTNEWMTEMMIWVVFSVKGY